MHFVVFLGVGYICLFLIPASIRNPRWFLAIWGLGVAILAHAFWRHYARAATADPLAQMFDRALLDVAAFACSLALFAWILRTIAQRLAWASYPHWCVLLLGCVAIPTALFSRFSH